MIEQANRVAIILDENGEFSHVVTDLPAEVYLISEATVRDRVYLLSSNHRFGPGEVAKVIGSSPIGHAGDAINQEIGAGRKVQ